MDRRSSFDVRRKHIFCVEPSCPDVALGKVSPPAAALPLLSLSAQGEGLGRLWLLRSAHQPASSALPRLLLPRPAPCSRHS